MTDVFMSYAHEDQAIVRQMVSLLEREGLSVWWDHTIPPGKSWDEVIAKGIEEAKSCIVIWSKHSVGSDWVKEEATMAKDGKKFLPVQIDDSNPPVGFRRVQAAQLAGWSGQADHPQWRMLVVEARSLARGATAPKAVGAPIAAPPAPPPPRYAAPTYEADAPAPKSGSKAPLFVAIAVIAALGIGWFAWNSSQTTEIIAEAPAIETPAPAEEPAAATTAPTASAADTELAAEVARLRAENQIALAAQREAEGIAARERQEREAAIARQRDAEQRADSERTARQTAEARNRSAAALESLVGSWAASSPDQGWTFVLTVNSDGTLVDDSGFPGRWRQTGSTIRLDFDVGVYYDGQMANGRVTGTYGGAGGSGTFVFERR